MFVLSLDFFFGVDSQVVLAVALRVLDRRYDDVVARFETVLDRHLPVTAVLEAVACIHVVLAVVRATW